MDPVYRDDPLGVRQREGHRPQSADGAEGGKPDRHHPSWGSFVTARNGEQPDNASRARRPLFRAARGWVSGRWLVSA